MNQEELKDKLTKVKRCIARRTVVNFGKGRYVPTALVLRKPKDEWIYSAELVDERQKKSTVTVGLDDVDWEG